MFYKCKSTSDATASDVLFYFATVFAIRVKVQIFYVPDSAMSAYHMADDLP